jgi:acetyltransferase-like isoleucine patch superfamily enzyme
LKETLKNIIHFFWKRNIHFLSIVKRDCTIARTTRVGPFCVIDGEGGKINIGERCSVNASSWIGAGISEINIGNDVRMGAGVKISCSHHNFDRTDIPIREQGIKSNCDISIGDDCWIGMGAIICPNVTIGSGVIVGAGSIVINDIPNNAIVVGNPAKIIKYRP